MAKCKIFLSDEGYGHIVRQRAIAEALLLREPGLGITVQTDKHFDTAQRIIPAGNFVRRFNNIEWPKSAGGSPDVGSIRSVFKDYRERSEQFVAEEMEESTPDFYVSDFVYEAFESASRKGIPAFGVAHFTWDWFFSKLYPPALENHTIHFMMEMAAKASRLYFPPFTPAEIVHHYRQISQQVPLIVSGNIDHKKTDGEGRMKVLVVDSGSGVLAEGIRKALASVNGMDDFLFFVSEKFRSDQSNLRYIPEGVLMVDFVADMDLVIGRAGFNTISECIGLRTPMLLIGEAMNPEMSENIVQLKHQHLGSFISLDTFENELSTFLPAFLKHEYKYIQDRVRNHSFGTNGAEVIAADILNRM